MVEVENKKIVKVYLGKSSKSRYFVGQLIPSMIKINNQKFLLCDGSPHVWTDKQKELLPESITSVDYAPNMIGRTTGGSRTKIGTTKDSVVPFHTHDVHIKSSYKCNTSAALSQLSICDSPNSYLGETCQGSRHGTLTGYSNMFGDETGTTSKRTYVYWYLFIGDE